MTARPERNGVVYELGDNPTLDEMERAHIVALEQYAERNRREMQHRAEKRLAARCEWLAWRVIWNTLALGAIAWTVFSPHAEPTIAVSVIGASTLAVLAYVDPGGRRELGGGFVVFVAVFGAVWGSLLALLIGGVLRVALHAMGVM